MTTDAPPLPIAWSVYNGKGEAVAVFLKQNDAEEYARVAFNNWEIRGTQALAPISELLSAARAHAEHETAKDREALARSAQMNASLLKRAEAAEQETAALRADVERLKTAYDSAFAQALENGALANSLRQDAMRYRWLRDVGDSTWHPLRARLVGGPVAVDAAIDAALAAKP